MTSELKARLQADMKSAMKAHAKARLTTIRMAIAAVKQREIDGPCTEMSNFTRLCPSPRGEPDGVEKFIPTIFVKQLTTDVLAKYGHFGVLNRPHSVMEFFKNPELRARVVGEGGNLGLTQLARVEYALAGGRINNDALDNSGGVDLSDHEVNFKLLLERGRRAGRVGADERRSWLRSCVDDVTAEWMLSLASRSTMIRFFESCSWINTTFSWPLTTK